MTNKTKHNMCRILLYASIHK